MEIMEYYANEHSLQQFNHERHTQHHILKHHNTNIQAMGESTSPMLRQQDTYILHGAAQHRRAHYTTLHYTGTDIFSSNTTQARRCVHLNESFTSTKGTNSDLHETGH